MERRFDILNRSDTGVLKFAVVKSKGAVGFFTVGDINGNNGTKITHRIAVDGSFPGLNGDVWPELFSTRSLSCGPNTLPVVSSPPTMVIFTPSRLTSSTSFLEAEELDVPFVSGLGTVGVLGWELQAVRVKNIMTVVSRSASFFRFFILIPPKYE